MGLIYSSADSSELMSALASNLSVARTTTSELPAGCQQLIAAIDGHTLSGVAYNAGKGLFSELVIPTIHRMTAAIDHVQSDLTKYGAANAFISSEGYLNEDKLKLQIKIMKASQKSLHEAAKQVATIAYNTPIPGIHNLLKDTQRTLIQMADSLQQDIDKIQKKLQKLNDFAMQINGLFNNSLNEMELAMQGVTVLNETTVKSNGTYTLPSGVDKSYFTEIKKDTSTVIDSEKQKIELIKPTDSIEEVSRKTIALANLGINPYTGEKINESQANRFKYAAWSGTLTDVGNVVLGSYYGNKAASRLDGLDDVGNVKQKSFSKKDSGTNLKVLEEVSNPIIKSPRTGSGLKIDDIKPIKGKGYIYDIDPLTGKHPTKKIQIIIDEFPHVPKAHGFSDIVDNYAGLAKVTDLGNAKLYQIQGSQNGVMGRFEWIIQNGKVTHRMFVRNIELNGVPIK